MKKVFAILLAIAMLLSLAVPAMAEESVKTHYEITITNSDAISSAGHVYSAYQIFTGVLDSTGKILTEIDWGQNFQGDAADAFVAALQADTTLGEGEANLFYGKSTAKEISDIMGDSANNTAVMKKAIGKAATAVVTADDTKSEPIAKSSQSNAPYTISIPLNMAGYYLITDTLSNPSAPNQDISDFIVQVVGDVTVEHKGSIPTMDKQVSETGDTYHDAIPAGIGETHYYRIIAELPDDYYLYDHYYLEFSDDMSKGLEFVEIDRVYVVHRQSNTRPELTEGTAGNQYTKEVTDLENGGEHLSIVIKDLKQAAPGLTSEDAVVVIYKAKVTADAVADGSGIPNQATIIYSNNPNTDGKGESTPDETNVYPINLNVVKVDGLDQTKPLNGAQFVLYRAHSTGAESHNEYAVVVDGKISKWVHHYESDDCCDDKVTHDSEIQTEGAATILETKDGGKLSVGGLKPGRYNLKEIKAPDGYNALTEDVILSFSITVDEVTDTIATITGKTNQGKIEFTPADANVTVTIDNYQGDTLPSTGGIGTTIFYAVGGLMVVAALVLLVTKKRMAAEV